MNRDGQAFAIWDHFDGTRNLVSANRYVPGSGWQTATILPVPDAVGFADDPDIAIDAAGDAIAVWRYEIYPEPASIYASRFTRGAGWGPPVLLESAPGEAFGPNGAGLVRLSLATDDATLEALAAAGVHTSMAGTDPEGAVFERPELSEAIRRALDKLPEEFRSAVVLVDIEDQSYAEAARVLGVPVGTVRSRLFRGRRLLQEDLLAYAEDAGLLARREETN